GYALSALKDVQEDEVEEVPWHRVINSQGRITISNREHSAEDQAQLLRAEGVMVSDDLRINLERHLWRGLHWLEIDDILREG
ncbi:MAG TPA: MGMT family protein, partial [Candidatus Binatia bacterium]|nr:MGMT family protein [Candidatus Binatia bacterium]